MPSVDGYRVIWVHSSDKQGRDALARSAAIEKGLAAIEALEARLVSRRSRLRSKTSAEQAAASALAQVGASRWITPIVTEETTASFSQAGPGRPGADTRYRRQDNTALHLRAELNAEAIAYDTRTDGCFPLITNDRAMTGAEVLAAYRYQPNLERRHHVLKGPNRSRQSSWRHRIASRPCSPATSSPSSSKRSSSARSATRCARVDCEASRSIPSCATARHLQPHACSRSSPMSSVTTSCPPASSYRSSSPNSTNCNAKCSNFSACRPARTGHHNHDYHLRPGHPVGSARRRPARTPPRRGLLVESQGVVYEAGGLVEGPLRVTVIASTSRSSFHTNS